MAMREASVAMSATATSANGNHFWRRSSTNKCLTCCVSSSESEEWNYFTANDAEAPKGKKGGIQNPEVRSQKKRKTKSVEAGFSLSILNSEFWILDSAFHSHAAAVHSSSRSDRHETGSVPTVVGHFIMIAARVF